MAKTLTLEISDDEAAEIEATLTGLTEEIRRATQKMAQQQLEIEGLKRQTSQLATETRQIGEQTRQALTRLEAAF